MKYSIDPRVDCVFKKLFGSEENRNLLIHFLNAVILPYRESPVTTVEIINPYNKKDFLLDKLSVVDVKKAMDAEGRTFHVELQISLQGGVRSRMVYYSSKIYSSQLREGAPYSILKPVISIWIMTKTLFTEAEPFHHHFQLCDQNHGMVLSDACSIHVLEIEKFPCVRIDDELERWLAFFKEGRNLDDSALPEFMNTQEMRQAMETLKLFSERERERLLYLSRMDALSVQATIEEEMRKAQEDKIQLEQERAMTERKLTQAEQELARVEQKQIRTEQKLTQVEQEKEAALKREKMLLEKLRTMGIDTDTLH